MTTKNVAATTNIFLIWSLFIAIDVFVNVPMASASSSSYANFHNNPNTYALYDMTTPLFTPDGRLMQVEYATLAATKTKLGTAPFVFLEVEDEIVVVASMSVSGMDMSGHDQDRSEDGGQDGTLSSPTSSFLKRERVRLQRRIVSMDASSIACTLKPRVSPMGSSSSSSSSLLLCMNGVLPDAVALLNRIKRYRVDHPYEDMDVSRVACVIGDACQSHSFGGGLRPYGCAFYVCGFDDNGRASIACAEPSGSIRKQSLVGNGGDDVENSFLLMGGEASMRGRIFRELNKALEKVMDSKSERMLSLNDGIEALVGCFLKIFLEISSRMEDFKPDIAILTRDGAQVIDDDILQLLTDRIIHNANENP